MPDTCHRCHLRPIRYGKLEICHTCYQAEHYQKRKAALGHGRARKTTDWFDWVAVNRAWLRWCGHTAPEVGRHLTNAEKLHLLYHAVAQGVTAPTDLRFLIGTDHNACKRLIDKLLSGEVLVYQRDELGRAGQPMPAL